MFFSLKNIQKACIQLLAIRDTNLFNAFICRFERMIATVDRLLTVVKVNLPQNMGDNQVLTTLINNLYITAESAVPRKVIQIIFDKYKLSLLR